MINDSQINSINHIVVAFFHIYVAIDPLQYRRDVDRQRWKWDAV